MAPEVFMKSNTEGHGRAADIWSIGCVIIEMASGKVCVYGGITVFKLILLQLYYHRDRGTSMIPITRLCSKWAWVSLLVYQKHCVTRVNNLSTVVYNTIRIQGQPFQNY